MTFPEALTELVIFARECGGDERPEILRAIQALERRLEQNAAVSRRRDARRSPYICLVCECRSSAGLLCRFCSAEAPERIRRAFELAVGLDGMRGADAAVRRYARNVRNGKERAA